MKQKSISIMFQQVFIVETRLKERLEHIKSFHFISTLATANPAFPLPYWESFIPQSEITINLLRCYRLNPAISAYHGIYGKSYDFLSHPIAPCGTKVVVLEPSDKRNSWSSHGVVGFYVGPELDVFDRI
jgi:hypothetical protein